MKKTLENLLYGEVKANVLRANNGDAIIKITNKQCNGNCKAQQEQLIKDKEQLIELVREKELQIAELGKHLVKQRREINKKDKILANCMMQLHQGTDKNIDLLELLPNKKKLIKFANTKKQRCS